MIFMVLPGVLTVPLFIRNVDGWWLTKPLWHTPATLGFDRLAPPWRLGRGISADDTSQRFEDAFDATGISWTEQELCMLSMISETCPGWAGSPHVTQLFSREPMIRHPLLIQSHTIWLPRMALSQRVSSRIVAGEGDSGRSMPFHRGGFPVLPDVPHGDA